MVVVMKQSGVSDIKGARWLVMQPGTLHELELELQVSFPALLGGQVAHAGPDEQAR